MECNSLKKIKNIHLQMLTYSFAILICIYCTTLYILTTSKTTLKINSIKIILVQYKLKQTTNIYVGNSASKMNYFPCCDASYIIIEMTDKYHS